MKPHSTTLPLCRYGHRLVAGNLILMGDQEKCQRCNRLACQRWYARRRVDLMYVAQEAALRRIAAESQTRSSL